MVSAIYSLHSTLTQGTQIANPSHSLWQECLEILPHDFYHLPGYLELEADRYDATAEAIVICEGEALFFLPYLIRDCDRLPDAAKFSGHKIYDVVSPYGYPGMLVNPAGQQPQFIKQCLKIVCDRWQQQGICSAFLRLHPLLNTYIDSSISHPERLVVCRQGDVVVCDLSQSIDAIWKQIRSNHRTKINKLQKAGFTTKIVAIDSYLDTFIEIYQETMNRVNAAQSYYFTREYFQNFVDLLGDRVFLCIVESEGRVVAANIITEFSGIVQYHLGGVRTEYLPQSPTTLAIYRIIEWAKSRNNRYVNLGGGLGGSSEDSLYHFKIGFSNISRSFVTIKTIVDTDTYDRLTCIRAESLGLTLPEIQDESYFPVYRLN